MTKNLAFVLSGGGSRGALQVGAMHALWESGIEPDLVIGTSIGAVNAAYLGMNGFSKNSLDQLSAAWLSVAQMDLLPVNYLLVAVRRMLGRTSADPANRIRDFIISQGVTPELRFADLKGTRLVVVSSDLNTGQPVLYGDQPEEKVLDAILLSTALPPWVMPVKKQDRYLMDGGIVSNLPIEPAIRTGATEIVALDLMGTYGPSSTGGGLTDFLGKLSMAIEKRQVALEMELAEARGVPTLYVDLAAISQVPFWNFHFTEDLIAQGYEITRQVIKQNLEMIPHLQGK